MLELIIIGLTTGFCTANIAKALDGWMDKGSIFDFVRINIARWYEPDFEKSIANKDKLTYHELEHEYRLAFWEVAKKHNSFTATLCADCMSVRLLLVFVIGFTLLINFDPVYFLIAFAANKFFLKY